MIPVKLRLRNFMCYRDNVPTLLLENIHVACLCGPNGAGKSALLDAITWALWGQARARSDDDLIHIGRDEMEVELEFRVLANRYRVVRKRQRGAGKRAGKTVLELQVSTGSSPGEEFRAISGSTVRETQQRIIHELRMDYQTFLDELSEGLLVFLGSCDTGPPWYVLNHLMDLRQGDRFPINQGHDPV